MSLKNVNLLDKSGNFLLSKPVNVRWEKKLLIHKCKSVNKIIDITLFFSFWTFINVVRLFFKLSLQVCLSK